MKINYHFITTLDKDTMKEIVTKNTKPLKIFFLLNENSFLGKMSDKKIIIGRIPYFYSISNISFFCGNIKQTENGISIHGRFEPPLKIMAIPYLVIFFFSLSSGRLTEIVSSIIGCYLLHIIQILLLSINTKSKKDIINFLQKELNVQEYETRKQHHPV